MNQLKLSLNATPPILSGKKEERITFTCSEEFKKLINLIADLQNTDFSKLGQRYFIEGISRDIGTMFMAEPYTEKTLREILQNFSANNK